MRRRKVKKLKTRKWYKHKNGNSFFYSPTPVYKTVRKLVGEGTHLGNPAQIEQLFLSMSDSPSSNMDGVYFFTIEDSTTVTDLPAGTYVFEPTDYPLPDRLVPVDFRTDRYIEMSGITENIMKDINTFLGSEEIYRDLGIQFKTGLLLYGPPGTGKTAVIRHIVRTRLPQESVTVVINNEIPDNDFIATIRETIPDRLKIFIFEEFTHFCLNELSMERILNFLDGEQSIDKSISFATTNYADALPHTIVSRHSRIEYLHKVDAPAEQERKQLLESFLKREVTLEEVKLTDKMTADAIKEICLLSWTKKLVLADAVKAVQDHLKIAKNAFKGNTDRIGF